MNDRSSLVHSMSFGSAYSDVLPTLLNGAALLPFDLKAESMHRFAAWLQEEQSHGLSSATLGIPSARLLPERAEPAAPLATAVSVGGARHTPRL